MHLALLDAFDPPIGNRSARHVACQVACDRNTVRVAFLNADIPVGSPQAVPPPRSSAIQAPAHVLPLRVRRTCGVNRDRKDALPLNLVRHLLVIHDG
jgi:hypothetical protein